MINPEIVGPIFRQTRSQLAGAGGWSCSARFVEGTASFLFVQKAETSHVTPLWLMLYIHMSSVYIIYIYIYILYIHIIYTHYIYILYIHIVYTYYIYILYIYTCIYIYMYIYIYRYGYGYVGIVIIHDLGILFEFVAKGSFPGSWPWVVKTESGWGNLKELGRAWGGWFCVTLPMKRCTVDFLRVFHVKITLSSSKMSMVTKKTW